MSELNDKVEEFIRIYGDNYNKWSEEARGKFDLPISNDFKQNHIVIESGRNTLVIHKGERKK
jgi:hypothetical protein